MPNAVVTPRRALYAEWEKALARQMILPKLTMVFAGWRQTKRAHTPLLEGLD
jgi:hypothetical protein